MTDRAVGGGVDDLPLPEHPATKSSTSAHSGLDDFKRTSVPNLVNRLRSPEARLSGSLLLR